MITMKRLALLFVLPIMLFYMQSCEQFAGYGDPPSLTIGDLSEGVVYQNIYSPPVDLPASENLTNSLSLDIDNDQSEDISFHYEFEFEYIDNDDEMHWTTTAKSRIYISPLKSNIKFCSHVVADTTYSCERDGIAPEYDKYEFTLNVGYTCPSQGYIFEVSQFLTGNYIKTFKVGDILSPSQNWYAGEGNICLHNYWKDIDDMHMSTGTIEKDFRRGLKNWENDSYLALSMSDGNKTHYGYVRLRMVQVEDYSWKLQIIETVMVK
ncbi:MAG: hypothetical protein HOD37_17485 [Bacteroidetes bacterium]|nr:hypothetical protein [Bacteroidota bacterium]